jgi:periplasmic protein TonB
MPPVQPSQTASPAPAMQPAPAARPAVLAKPALPLPPPPPARPRFRRLAQTVRKILPVHAISTTQEPVTDSQAVSPRPTATISSQSAAQAAQTWQSQLTAWLQAHKRYPEAARDMDEEGNVQIRFTVAPDGHVTAVSVVRGSGVPTLNDAALAILQGATVPALPPGMGQSAITITVELRYALNE